MSRWVEQFENHAFQASWECIKEKNDNIEVDDDTVTTDVEEIARFKKVVTFLNGLIASCDPELVPESIWVNFQRQTATCLQQLNQYETNRDISHIRAANANLDNLLTYLRPYNIASGKAAESASSSFSAYSRTINSELSAFQSSARKALHEIEEVRDKTLSQAEEVNASTEKIMNLENYFFDDTDGIGIRTKVDKFRDQAESTLNEILEYRKFLLEDGEDESSISTTISAALDSSKSDRNTISELLTDVQKDVHRFQSYHEDVFGQKNEQGELVGGLKSEIMARVAHLDDFKEAQEKKYNALTEEIESLLPGATSAGLASAYKAQKDSFNIPIVGYLVLFYVSVVCLVVVALFSVSSEIGYFYVKFVQLTEIKTLALNILHRLPVVVPVLWLAIFASKRRSECARLKQEYAHKEAIAKSYENFKEQISALNEADPELMKKLIGSAIDAISKNASDTLDKRHGDKLPFNEGAEAFVAGMERVKKVVDKK